jgi:hypothetical protein
MAVKRTLVYHEPPNVLRAIVPRTQGDGFLKRPLGHGDEEWTSALEDAVRGDVTDYDGHVEVETFADTGEVAQDFARALEDLWGFPARFVDRAEFYDSHPVVADADWKPAR